MPRNYADLIDYKETPSDDRDLWSARSESNKPEWKVKDLLVSRKPRNRSTEIDQENTAIEAEILAARFMLEIEAEVGERDFVPYLESTLSRAVTFLRRFAMHAHSCGFSGIGVPEILPAGQGSVDILWRFDNKQLLMNFSANSSERVSYYGKKGSSEISGRFNVEENRSELVFWLAS